MPNAAIDIAKVRLPLKEKAQRLNLQYLDSFHGNPADYGAIKQASASVDIGKPDGFAIICDVYAACALAPHLHRSCRNSGSGLPARAEQNWKQTKYYVQSFLH